MNGQPSLPYAGTEGHARRDTSRARAGVRGESQQRILRVLLNTGPNGCTRAEMEQITGWGGGRVSGALSALHKDDKVAMLAVKRARQHVYVLPEYVHDRPTRARTFNAAHDLAHDCWDAWRAGDLGSVEAMLRRYCEAAPR